MTDHTITEMPFPISQYWCFLNMNITLFLASGKPQTFISYCQVFLSNYLNECGNHILCHIWIELIERQWLSINWFYCLYMTDQLWSECLKCLHLLGIQTKSPIHLGVMEMFYTIYSFICTDHWYIILSLNILLSYPSLGWLYVSISFSPHPHLHPPQQQLLFLTYKPLQLNLKYFGQWKYRSGEV